MTLRKKKKINTEKMYLMSLSEFINSSNRQKGISDSLTTVQEHKKKF